MTQGCGTTGALAGVLLAACAPAPLVLSPPGGAAGTVIAAFERGASLEALAVDRVVVLDAATSRGYALRDFADGDEVVRVTLIRYTEAPRELGLSAGVLALKTDGCHGLTSIPTPRPPEVLASVAADGAASEWAPATLSAPLAALRVVDACDPCDALRALFAQEPVTLDTNCTASFAERAADGAVLVGSEATLPGSRECHTTGRLYRVSPSGAAEAVRVSPASRVPAEDLARATTSTPSAGAWFDASGALWLAGDRGDVWRAKLEPSGVPARPWQVALEATTRLASAPTSTATFAHARWMDGGAGEIFARTVEGVFERFDGTRWTLLHRDSPQPLVSHGAVAWLGPGEALSATILDAQIGRYSGGRYARVPLAAARIGEGPAGLASIPGAGLFAGTTEGGLYRFDATAQQWTRYHPDTAGSVLAQILPVSFPSGEGILATGSDGFAWWTATPSDPATLRRCEGFVGHSVRHAARLGERDWVLAGTVKGTQEKLVITLLRRR